MLHLLTNPRLLAEKTHLLTSPRLLAEKTHYLVSGKKGLKRQILDRRPGRPLDKILIVHRPSRLCYVSVPKVANTFIKRMFWAAEGKHLSKDVSPHVIKSRLVPYKLASHFSDKELNTFLADPTWTTFSFVRDPFSRLISTYKNKISNRAPHSKFWIRLGWREEKPPSSRFRYISYQRWQSRKKRLVSLGYLKS